MYAYGRMGSLYLPWLGIGFLMQVPVGGDLLSGTLIYRFATALSGGRLLVGSARRTVTPAAR
jgi:hypothetical protein